MRRSTLAAVTLVASISLLAGACGDARLDKLTLGISKDSAAGLIGQAPHRSLSYLTAGKVWDVQLYGTSTAAPADSIPWRKMSPVIFINGKAVGWGWSWWDREAAQRKLPMPPKD